MRLYRGSRLLSSLSVSSSTTFIYGLCDPTTGQIRYVGKADDPNRRCGFHISSARNPKSSSYKTYTARWIRDLDSKGMKPYYVVLEWVPVSEWEHWEKWWIDFFFGIGCRLVNTGEAGLGAARNWNKGKPKTADQRKKMSEARKGKSYGPRGPFSPEAREAIRQGLLRAGVKPPPLAYENARKSVAGKPAWNRGKKMSEETCRKLSAMRMGNTFTLGYKQTEETKARMSAAQLRRRERERGPRQS